MTTKRSLRSWGNSAAGSVANFRTDVIEIVKFGYSSCHSHKGLANGFILVSGAVDIIQDDDTLSPCELRTPGDSCLVMPDVLHQFFALEDSVIVEFYVAAGIVNWDGLPPYDITRHSQNGIAAESTGMAYLDGRKPRWIGATISPK